MGNSNQKLREDQPFAERRDWKFTCEICKESISKTKQPKNKCGHLFCKDCIAKYKEDKLKDKTVVDRNIVWPCLSCNTQLDPLSCSEIRSPGLFAKWYDVMIETFNEIWEIRGANDAFMRLMWVQCPGCGHCIESFEGCSHVLCSCSSPFCCGCQRESETCVCWTRLPTNII